MPNRNDSLDAKADYYAVLVARHGAKKVIRHLLRVIADLRARAEEGVTR